MRQPSSICAGTFFVLALLAPAGSGLRAELTWERTVVSRTAKVGEEVLEVEFRYSNPGDRPVQILSVRPGCGCLLPSLDTDLVEPGASGALRVIFDGQGLNGTQEKRIEVATHDAPGRPAILTVRITLPLWLTIEPVVLAWPTSSPAEPKESRVVWNPANRLVIHEVSSADPNLQLRWHADTADGLPRIIVTPVSTSTPHDSTVVVKVRSPLLAVRHHLLVVRIR